MRARSRGRLVAAAALGVVLFAAAPPRPTTERSIAAGNPSLLDAADDSGDSQADFSPLATPTPCPNAAQQTATACQFPPPTKPGTPKPGTPKPGKKCKKKGKKKSKTKGKAAVAAKKKCKKKRKKK